jgi:metallo-beta-lactamase class B
MERTHRAEFNLHAQPFTAVEVRMTGFRAFLLGIYAVAFICVLYVGGLQAQGEPAEWRQPQAPVRIFGNTYYIGTRGLSSILITSAAGDVLIDGALPESAQVIANHIRALGFRIEDVRLIVNSHVHYDHAGGISELQRLSKARVAASPASAAVLTSGRSGPDDPQFGVVPPISRVENVQVFADGEVLRVGSVAVRGHFTGGHTPGGTSWSWRSCEGTRCLDIVYADSLTAVSADGFSFSRNTTYRRVLGDFEKSFAFLRDVSCDILLTPHPGASGLWDRVARRDAGTADALIDRTQCAQYAERSQAQLRARLEREGASGSPK